MGCFHMSAMFYWAGSFNGSLSSWDVSSVTDMSGMFYWAKPFNGNLSPWDVSRATDFYGMFYWAGSFNGDLSSWNVSSVTNMSWMFLGAESFNQSLCDWGQRLSPSGVLVDKMFRKSGCPNTSNPSNSNPEDGPWCHPCTVQ